MTKIIGFDMDGVIIDHSHMIVALAKEKGFDLALNQTNPTSLKEILPLEPLNSINERLYTDRSIVELSSLMPDALDTLKFLKRLHGRLLLLSRRSDQTGQAILSHFRLNAIFDEADVFFVDRSAEKTAIAHKYRLTHYVDDQASALLETMQDIDHKLLFDQFGVLLDNEAYERVTSWLELGDSLR